MLLFIIFVFIVALFITLYLRFPQLKAFRAIKKCKNQNTKQTFYLSLATNLGVGNLIGVSTAIYLGGPGVIFWMAFFAIFSSALAFLENYYAISAQINTKHGTFSGTCYTIIHFMNSRVSRIIAFVFSIFLILSNSIFFPPIQINAIVSIVNDKYQLILGIILVLLVLLVIIGGIKRILKITDRFVPLFCVGYFIILIIGILINFNQLDRIMNLILKSAFNFKTIGISGFISMLKTAISKSIFSNEAGLGTIPSLTGISDPKEKEVVSYYQLLGVIIDTVVFCSLTGIFILCFNDGFTGNIAMMLPYCFIKYLGNIGLVIYMIFITFFGLTSVFGLYYLGENNTMFISLYSKIPYGVIKLLYQCIFMVGIVIGIVGSFSSIMWLVDIGIMLLGTLNLVILCNIEKRHKLLKNNHKIT